MANALESQGFKLEYENGDSPLTYTEVQHLTSMSGPDGTASQIDVTTLQSTAKKYIMGLQDNGQISFDGNYAPTDTGQASMYAAKASRTAKNFRITFGEGTTWEFSGYVLSASSSASVDAKVDVSFTVLIDGDITITPGT